MKKFILTATVIFSILSSSFAQFTQASLLGWPTDVIYPNGRSSANKIVSDGSYYYAITDDQGIYRIATGSIGTGTWSQYVSGLPAAGIVSSGPYAGTPFYGIYDMDISGGYIYVECAVSGSSVPRIYRASLSSGTFSNISPSTALNSGQTYLMKAVGNYVYIANSASTTADVRYSLNTGTSWTSLTVNPSSTTPNYMTCINALSVSGRYDFHICASNGLFIVGLNSSGAPNGSQGLITALANCPQIEYLYNSSGVFTWAYLSQLVTITPGHPTASQIIRIATGSSTPSSVTMTPSNTQSGGAGLITCLSSWQGNAHFGVESTSGALSNILYKGDNTANNFVLSTFCGGTAGPTGTAGTVCMYTDGTTRLLAGEYGNAVWYTTNTACKTDDETGIADLVEDNIKVYPMPASSQLHIVYPYSAGEQPLIELYDMQGRKQELQASYTSAGQATIDVSALSKGAYILQYNGANKIVKRIVVD